MPPENFSISTTSLAECELVVVRGDLDSATALDFVSSSEGAVSAQRPVVIDISEVGFVDSRGIHALIQAAGDGRRVSLVCPGGNVARVLSIVSIEQVMPVYESLDAALAELR